MGGGASTAEPESIEEKLLADAPIRRASLQSNGSPHRTKHELTYQPLGGSPKQSNEGENARESRLSILGHIKDIRALEGAIQKPACPQCARGNHTTSTCRICGAAVQFGNVSDGESLTAPENGVKAPISPIRTTQFGDKDHAKMSTQAAVYVLLETEALKRRRQSVENAGADDLYKKIQAKRRAALMAFTDENEENPWLILKPQKPKKEKFLDDPKADTIPHEIIETRDLAPPTVTVQCRTSNSLTINWDCSPDEVEALAKVVGPDGHPRRPLYDVMVRPYNKKLNEVKSKFDGKEITWKSCVVGTETTSLEIPDLLPNSAFEFRCRRIGWGDWGSSTIIRTGPGPPSAPNKLTAKEVSSSSILLAWEPVDKGKDNGSPVTHYVVRTKEWGGNELVDVYSGRERFFLATGLAFNTVHVFEVYAVNLMGIGNVSAHLAQRTLAKGAPEITPWVEGIDDDSGHIYYSHPRSGSTSWALPKGALVDTAASFKNKLQYLLKQVKRRAFEACSEMGRLSQAYVFRVEVDRENILEESLQVLHAAAPDEVDGGVARVTFRNEEGMDAGGLAKDWFGEVSKALLTHGGLFQANDTGVVTIDHRTSTIHRESDVKWMFRAIGVFLAKAIQDSQTLGLALSPTLLSLLCGRVPTLEQLQMVEPEIHRGLQWVMDNDVTDAELTFSVSVDVLGDVKTVDLVQGGENRIVDENNKYEYIELMKDWLTRRQFEPAISHLIEGFTAHMPTADLAYFSLQEVQLLLGGQPSIEVSQIRQDVQFAGFKESSSQVKWLWEILDTWDGDKLSKFLSFVTGCDCMPVDGLRPPLNLTLMQLDEGVDPDKVLPRAHTCFNQFVVPPYSSSASMEDRLLFALTNTQQGFFMS